MKKKSQGKSSRRKHNTPEIQQQYPYTNTTDGSKTIIHFPAINGSRKNTQSAYTHSKDIKKSAISVEIADLPCLRLLICRFSRFFCYHCIFNVTMQFVNATEIIYLVKERESNT